MLKGNLSAPQTEGHRLSPEYSAHFIKIHTMDTFAKSLPGQIKTLWNFSAVSETETKFRELLAKALAISGASGIDAAANVGQQFPEVLELLTQIARTQGLQRKFDDAHETLDTVLYVLLPSSSPIDRSALPTTKTRANVRYLLERGRVYNSNKEKSLALPLFKHAWEIATQCSPEEEDLAVDAAHMVAIAEPTTDMQTEWNLLALAKAETSSDDATRKWIGSLTNNLGWTYHNANKFGQALEMFEKALRFRVQVGETSSIIIAKWSVARCLRSLDRIDEALVIQQALLLENEQLNAPDGYNFEELGELLLLQGKSVEAQMHFQRAVELLSADEWFATNEKERLARLQKLASA